MKTVKLNNDLVPAFRKYFDEFSKLQDESYPPPEDYTVNNFEPAYLLMDDTGKIAGAAALMMTPEYIEAGSARFRMFYCNEQVPENYRVLLNEIKNHIFGLQNIYCFTEDKYTDTCKAWESIGFEARRFAWVLERESANNKMPAYPPGYELKTFRQGIDEDSWCSVINDAFGRSKGHVRMTPDRINEWRREPSWLEDGMKLLWHNGRAVGSIGLTRDSENGEDVIFIDAIGVLHELHGKGLGKNLLLSGIKYAAEKGIKKVKLSVNAENEKAADMYFKEGFVKEALYKCYYYDIKK